MTLRRWKVTTEGWYTAGLEIRLAQGWEPYAADGSIVYLRKLVWVRPNRTAA